ncbi:MAG: hypothetical protein BWY88_00426 [Synergistetes bacterium ADurb.Bin520]|nr:MAG: hypothetical protein BWY88_00426 [Synergistetes bacterium ADurb.Bin520]
MDVPKVVGDIQGVEDGHGPLHQGGFAAQDGAIARLGGEKDHGAPQGGAHRALGVGGGDVFQGNHLDDVLFAVAGARLALAHHVVGAGPRALGSDFAKPPLALEGQAVHLQGREHDLTGLPQRHRTGGDDGDAPLGAGIHQDVLPQEFGHEADEFHQVEVFEVELHLSGLPHGLGHLHQLLLVGLNPFLGPGLHRGRDEGAQGGEGEEEEKEGPGQDGPSFSPHPEAPGVSLRDRRFFLVPFHALSSVLRPGDPGKSSPGSPLRGDPGRFRVPRFPGSAPRG